MGGHTIHSGGKHDFLISLAPYVWRIPMLVVTFVVWLLNQKQPEWYYLTASF